VSRLDGVNALVTGAGSGIGAASARALASAGAAVAVTDVNGPAAATVAKQIVADGGRAWSYVLDVSDESQWIAAIAAARVEFGAPITVLHNNAAITAGSVMARDLDVTQVDLELWDQVMAVTLRGAMLGCKHIIPGMLEAGGGSIVSTSSVKGMTGSSYRVAYATAKGGINALTLMVAASHGKKNIRCNAIAPGIVETPGMRETIPAQHLAILEEGHLLPRLGAAEDIAAAVVFLASADSSFITGQVIAVDGGLISHSSALSPPGSR
jgi:NAD(P)-dependent dehydrogenase (short-subunit alcohol dehydrogenase family)